ncbi:hypothetical protein LSH36_404g03022 [Paralvinella palmiformis]|uniref:Uncharacterized protein n=1 Tax=Paralvinella palmiformis TaxID=53620 RepID=A0AAD9JDM5_9ANNE|nr:hypothetical protein LSH36_404g03022 [Paralvinella palmiformis]
MEMKPMVDEHSLWCHCSPDAFLREDLKVEGERHLMFAIVFLLSLLSKAIKDILPTPPRVQCIVVDFEDAMWLTTHGTIPEIERKGSTSPRHYLGRCIPLVFNQPTRPTMGHSQHLKSRAASTRDKFFDTFRIFL